MMNWMLLAFAGAFAWLLRPTPQEAAVGWSGPRMDTTNLNLDAFFPVAGGETVPAGPDDAWMPYADPQQDTVAAQLPTIEEQFIVTAQAAAQSMPSALGFGPAPVEPATSDGNVRAFLDMIAYSEGTGGPNGYYTLFGGGLVGDLVDHPHQYFDFTNNRGQHLKTSAAGRYQFLARTWDTLKAKLDLPDFSPQSQDLAAIELIRERGALADVQAGRVAAAVKKCAPVWASLPGAGYAQPERKLTALVATYQAAGGNLET